MHPRNIRSSKQSSSTCSTSLESVRTCVLSSQDHLPDENAANALQRRRQEHDVAERLRISSPCNFLEIQTFEKEHLNRLPLSVWKRREGFGWQAGSSPAIGAVLETKGLPLHRRHLHQPCCTHAGPADNSADSRCGYTRIGEATL